MALYVARIGQVGSKLTTNKNICSSPGSKIFFLKKMYFPRGLDIIYLIKQIVLERGVIVGALVSIDWDFFIKEDLMMDFGHSESMNNDFLWGTRVTGFAAQGNNLLKMLQTNGKEREFWNRLRGMGFNFNDQTHLIITESHADAYDLVEYFTPTSIINFDSHSDLGYKGLKSLYNESVSCENWLGKSMIDFGPYYVDDVTLVYSNHTLEKNDTRFDEIIKKLSVDVKYEDDFFSDKPIEPDIDVIHVCRSGAWAPPWLDSKLFSFIKRSGCNIFNEYVKPRKLDYRSLYFQGKEQAKIFEAFLQNYDLLKTASLE